MNEPKTSVKGLDITRLILSILMLILGVFVTIVLTSVTFATINDLKTDEDAVFSGLLFIFIIPIVVIDVWYFVAGIKGIKKYRTNKITHLLDRKVNYHAILSKLIAIPVALLFFSFQLFVFIIVPLLPYFICLICDVVEAKRYEKLKKPATIQNVEQVNSQPKVEQERPNIEMYSDLSKKKRCRKCGAKVDLNTKYCPHCDNEFEK